MLTQLAHCDACWKLIQHAIESVALHCGGRWVRCMLILNVKTAYSVNCHVYQIHSHSIHTLPFASMRCIYWHASILLKPQVVSMGTNVNVCVDNSCHFYHKHTHTPPPTCLSSHRTPPWWTTHAHKQWGGRNVVWVPQSHCIAMYCKDLNWPAWKEYTVK